MAEARPRPDWARVALPWSAALTVTGACVAVGLLSVLVRSLQARIGGAPAGGVGSLGTVGIRSAWAALYWAVGLVAGDRALPHWPRAARWALGLGLGSLVPDPGFVLQMIQHPLHPPHPADMTTQLLPWVPFAILFGYFLGLAARRPEGVLWRLPVVGVAIQAGPMLVLLLIAAVFVPSSLPTGRGAVFTLVWCLAEGVLHGGLLGLAVGERLRAAWRRALSLG